MIYIVLLFVKYILLNTIIKIKVIKNTLGVIIEINPPNNDCMYIILVLFISVYN